MGFSDLWSGQKPWWNRYLTPVVNFWELRWAQLAKSSLLTSTLRWCPWDIYRPLKFVLMLKREWGAENNGKLPHLSIPSKTAAWVPVFAMKTCLWSELWPLFLKLQWRTCLWAEHSYDDINIYCICCIIWFKLHFVHRCGAGGSMRACHAASQDSIPGRDRFPGWGFFRGFSSPLRQMSGSFRPTRPPNIIWPP